ncbi:amidoligase family protein [Oceanicola sp. S124]|uniref:amidoligase family protein n=1 Tax=Oceanicola sp. S124 TaxID=1042378 RepID=UPI0002557937|nr:amidoligase family protein [Oceanicola sp. S124]
MTAQASRPLTTLPRPKTAEGKTRLLGVEVEFGGLTEARAARILAEGAGSSAQRRGGDFEVEGTPFGTCKLYMDTSYRDHDDTALGRAALDLARNVVPVELVTEPFAPDRLDRLDDVLKRFRTEGATGTRDGLFLGFGVHLNVQYHDGGVDHLWSTLTAFALAEPLLREAYDIDFSRRALPFVDPYPNGLLDALAMGAPTDVPALIALYLRLSPSRNHALDMLPIFAHLAPEQTRKALARGAGGTVSARPAYHYRMPDCRIDNPGWSLAGEWALWCAIEELAEDRGTLERLCTAWRKMRDDPLERLRGQLNGWTRQSRAILAEAGHERLEDRARALTG